MGEVQLRFENLGDYDPSRKSSRQVRDELRDATRSLYRREKGDLFNFKSVRLAEEEMVVLDLPGLQKAGARGNKPDPTADNAQDDTEADRKALLKLAKKLVKAKQPRESEPSSDSDEDDLQVPHQVDKASCSASSSMKNAKPQMDPNGGKPVSQQDLRHQRRIITPQALQQWWLERVQLSEDSGPPPKGPTGLSSTAFKQQLSRGARPQLQPDVQRVAAMKKSVTMTFDASANSSDPEANGSCQPEKQQRFDPRMKRIVSGGRLKHGPEPGGGSGRNGDIFEERYSRRPQHSPGAALEANIHALGKAGLGGTFEVQGRTFEVASRGQNSQSQKLSMLMTGRNGAQPTGLSDSRSAPTSRESGFGGAKVMYDSMDARQSTLQLPPVPGARPGPGVMQLPQGDGATTYDSCQTNSSKAIQNMHQMQREYSRKKSLLHKTRSGGAGQRPLMMQGAV